MKSLVHVLLLGSMVGSGCAGQRASAPAAPAEVAPAADPWLALSQGDFPAAQAGFQVMRKQRDKEEEAMAGLLSVAQATVDVKTADTLLDSVEAASASPLLAVTAGEVALDQRPLPPVTVALAQRACQLKDESDLGQRASDVCSWLPLAQTGQTLEQCIAGCGKDTRVPLFFAGNQPVVLASVNGGEPAPFIVDTGASTSVLTRSFASKAGIAALPGTEFMVQATGGKIATSRALVSFDTSGVVIHKVPVILVDLPFDSIAGIIAPQNTWRSLNVKMDFRALEMTLSPSMVKDGSLVALPYLQHESRPMVLFETTGRPRRPIVLDTGAFNTTLDVDYDALGTPMERQGEGRVSGAGGQGSKAWSTKVTLDAQAGGLTWKMRSPVLMEGSHQNPGPVRSHGLLGMDMMMGRQVILDVAHARIWFSKDPRLKDWPVGSATTYHVKMDGLAQPVQVHEKVVERKDDSVVMEVTYAHPSGPRHFRYQMPDVWQTRGTWLISRPTTRLWDLSSGEATEVDVKKAADFWLPVFVPFKTVPGTSNPRMEFMLTHGTSCTSLTLPAQVKDASAELTLVDCPADVWRTRQILLQKTGEATPLWDVRRGDGP